MSSYQSDDEQIEALHKWWKENGRALITGVVLAVVLVLGWDAWKQQTAKAQAEAAVLYQSLLDTAGNPGSVLDDVAYTTAAHLAERLQNDAARTAYATYAALLMARVHIDRGNLDEGLVSLRWASEHAADETLAQLARLRASQVQFALGHADEALAGLATLPADSYLTPLALQLKGDIQVSRNERQLAHESYQAAMDWLAAHDENPIRLLEVKRDALRIAEASATVPVAGPSPDQP
ncbi:MAG TPA: tetratricopeptide repeat protein [Pseudomonadales bacterium]